jgi:hypothetical protein
VVFVLSSAVLDAGYGAALRAVLDGAARVVALIGSPRERWFRDAAVHGVIMVIERTTPAKGIRFVRMNVPVEEAAARVRCLAELDDVSSVRTGSVDDAWAPLLRAPDAWFQVAPHLVPLSELADVRRGATSGANELFYLPADTPVEPAYRVPLLKTPRDARQIRLDVDRLPTSAFVCRELPPPGTAARAHVDAHAHLSSRPTLAARPRWWSLEARPARLFLTKAYGARFVQHLASRDVIPDQRVYAVTPRPQVSADTLAAVLNGTLTALAIEALGRASMGQGALELSVADAERLPVVDPRRPGLDARALAAAFGPLSTRVAGDVFAEADAQDRRALDELLCPPPLRPLLPELRAALVSTVGDRLARSR